MKCSYCNSEILETDNFCVFCGNKVEAPIVAEHPQKKDKKGRKVSTVLIVAVVCILLGIGSTLVFLEFFTDSGLNGIINEFIGDDEDDNNKDVDIDDITVDDSEDEDYVTQADATTEITTSAVASTVQTTVDAGKLYRPAFEKFCNQYTRYISGYSEGQAYAKMRFGPSKTDYNVVGQIDNGSVVTVQTESVNGWTLIYYQGTEGWVRTDFLYATYDECFSQIIQPDTSFDGYYGFVDVTPPYDGQNLNMRSGPAKDYELITKVPDGADVTIYGLSDQTNEWVYILYNGNYGWVLSEYVFEYGN